MRLRRPPLAIVAAAALATATATALAAPGTPRLSGRFPVAATITESNFTGVKNGTKTSDVYTFTAVCRAKKCTRVKLVRRGGTARKNYRSTLTLTRAGTYTGTEGPYAYPCPKSGRHGTPTFTARHTITVTKTRAGRVTAIRGTSAFKIAHCSVGSLVNYRFSGLRAPSR